jgi:hypothetical protein
VDDIAGALEDYQLCLRQSLDVPHDWYHYIVYSLVGIGDVAGVRGKRADAAKLLAASARLNVQRGVLVSMGNPHEYVCFERSMAAAAEHRRDPLFEAAWQEGEKLTLQEAAALALEQ